MINVTNELQYLLVIELLEKAAAAGFMDHDELARARRLAVSRYSHQTVWE